MFDVTRTTFELDAPRQGETALRAYALNLFGGYERQVSTTLPLLDYGLELDIEEGSLRGNARTWATAATLVGVVTCYGDIRQGVRELRNDARVVHQWLIEEAPKPFGLGADSYRRKRQEGTVLASIEKVLHAVQAGTMSSSEAVNRIRTLVDGEEELPSALVEELERQIRSVPQGWQQMDIPFPALEAIDQTDEDSRPKRQAVPREKGMTAPDRWRIEIRKDTKHGDALIRTIHL
ncbi:MAG: hypothetical protein LC687_06475 [Actinobacteria bacterium]|nr:hypothetical protein [Actinomycetota bacterium]